VIDKELLEVLACPETKQDLELANQDLIAKINVRIEARDLVNRAGQKVTVPLQEGLVQKKDRNYLYPVREGIPVMLIDEAIPLEGLH